MPSAADFLKSYSAPAPASGAPSAAPAPEKKSADSFLTEYGGKPGAVKPKKSPEQDDDGSDPGLISNMVEGFVDPTRESIKATGEDLVASQRQFASPEEEEAYKGASLGDRAKVLGKGVLATAKLPLDAAGTVLSPIIGGLKGGVMTPIAQGYHAIQPTVRGAHPEGYVAPYTDIHGNKHPATVLSKEELAKYKKQQTEQPANMDYFKGPENKNRPRPMLEGSTKDIATGLTDMVLDASMLAVPADVAAFRATAGKVPRSTFGNLTSRIKQSPEEFAKIKTGEALKKSGVTKEAAKEKLSKPGTSISDLGDSAMVEIGEQAAMSGEGRRLGGQLYGEERLKGRRGRVATAVNKIANDKNMYEHIDELKTSQIETAKPLYQEAFTGGSQAALLGNLEEHFATTSRGVSEAAQEVRDAENMVTQVNARHVGESDNVYSTASRNDALREANRRKLLAEEKLDKAQAARDGALERLNVAQEHEEAGVHGGLWSPRLDRLMREDFVTSGTARGIEIQKLEAAVAGDEANLSEWALKPGSNLENPIASQVPNLRLLDAMKRGMDAQLYEKYWDKNLGKLVLDDLGRVQKQARDEFVKEVDRLAKESGNTAYTAAREAWSGPQGIIDATHDGMKFDNIAPELLTKRVGKLKPAELEGYRIGVVRKIADKVAEGPAAALKVARDIVGDEYYQRQLKAVLGDEHFAHILELSEQEVQWAERGSQMMGGSQTARRQAGSKDFDSFLGDAGDEIVGALQGRAGGYGDLNPHRLGMNIFSRWLDRALTGMSQARRDAVGKMIFSTNKEDNLEAIEMIYDEGMLTTPQYSKLKKTGVGAAGMYESTSHPRMERQEADEEAGVE